MRRLFVVVVALCALLVAAPASAGYWSWLEQFSGPGPLRARKWQTPVLSTLCVQDGGVRPSPIADSNRFHRRQWAIAQEIARLDPPQDARAVYGRMLASPLLSEGFYAAGADLRQLVADLAKPAAVETQAVTRTVGFYRDDRANDGLGHTDRKLICGYFDVGSFTNEVGSNGLDLNGFPRVTARLVDFGGVARLHDGLDIGGGIGIVRFTSEPGDRTIRKTALTLTPLRTVIRPLLLVVPEHHRKQWMGILSLYWKETYIADELAGADFGVPDNPYRSNGELVRSFGLTFDLTALVPPLKR